MKKITIVAIAAALVLGGCQTKREKENAEDPSQHKIDSLQRVIEQSNTESKDLAATIQQIRDGSDKSMRPRDASPWSRQKAQTSRPFLKT